MAERKEVEAGSGQLLVLRRVAGFTSGPSLSSSCAACMPGPVDDPCAENGYSSLHAKLGCAASSAELTLGVLSTGGQWRSSCDSFVASLDRELGNGSQVESIYQLRTSFVHVGVSGWTRPAIPLPFLGQGSHAPPRLLGRE